MPEQETTPAPPEAGKWFAPSSGGYSAGRPGQIVRRSATPPKIPATAAGLRHKKQDSERGAVS